MPERAGIRGVDYPATERTTDGFLTLDGLLMAVARSIGQDPEPHGPPCIPEVMFEREDAEPLFFGVTDVGWNGDGGVTIRVEVR